jgi:hypothetical protein
MLREMADNSPADDFIRWVSDPSRTTEELFTVEVLLERVRDAQWPFRYVDTGLDAEMERARERKLNPAYRPSLHLDELRELARRAEKVKYFSGAYGEDRPLRDLKAFRFFPYLEQLSVQSSDVTDFTPIASLPRLQQLSISEYSDLYGHHQICLAECGEKPVLERVHLSLRHPWPDLRALSSWPAMDYVKVSANVLALEGLDPFPAAREVAFNNWPGGRVELRDLTRLPLLPRARQLSINTTASLDGVERYPSVVNLHVSGCFRDLTPLAAMHNITAVTLGSEFFHDLRPLTLMRSLREIKFVREWPLDLSPLSDCPQLRRVEYERCSMMRTEVAALNAGLLPEAEDFLIETPRPLPPLRFYRAGKIDDAAGRHFSAVVKEMGEARAKFYDSDAVFAEAEKRAFCNAMQAQCDELLGRGWGIFRVPFTGVRRYPDTLKLRELVEIVRQYSARSRFPWHMTFIIEPHGDMSEELEEIKARYETVEAPDEDWLMQYYEPETLLKENEEQRKAREERYEVLKREHQARLQGAEAAELLYLPEDQPEPAEKEEEEPLTPADDDQDDEGGVAIAPPPPAPPETKDFAENLMFYLSVYEEGVTVTSHFAAAAEYHLGAKLEEWTPG